MKPFKCKTCEEAFVFKSDLDTHSAIIHSSKNSLKSHLDAQNTETSSETGKETTVLYKCPICRLSFKSKQEIQEHKNRHKGIKPHKCPQCDNCFSGENELKLHLNAHDVVVNKPFQCSHCHKQFAQHAHWTAHLRTHTGVKPFKCNLCPKSFRQQSHLGVHKNLHTGDKPFECSVCKERFRLPHTLKSHMTRHTGERPYKCDQCPKAFSQCTPLNHHVQKVHGNGKYPCFQCDKVFPSKVQLKTHQRVHYHVREFFCVFCDKGCFTRGDLMKHLRSHTQERPFVCLVCGTWYRESTRRKACQDSHSPPPPSTQKRIENPVLEKALPSIPPVSEPEPIKTFQCKICLKVMNHQNQLNGHMAVHTKRKKLVKRKGSKKRKRLTLRKPPKAKVSTGPGADGDDDGPVEDDFLIDDEIEIEYASAEDHMITTDHIVEKLRQLQSPSPPPPPEESELRIESVRHIPVMEMNKLKKNHVVANSTNFRPFQCDFCNKMFAEKGILDKHLQIHGVVTKPPPSLAPVQSVAKTKKIAVVAPTSQKRSNENISSPIKASKPAIQEQEPLPILQPLASPEIEVLDEQPIVYVAPPAILEIFDDDDDDDDVSEDIAILDKEVDLDSSMPILEQATLKDNSDPLPIPPVLVDETRDDLVTKLLQQVVTVDDNYKCGKCGATFSKKTELEGHKCKSSVQPAKKVKSVPRTVRPSKLISTPTITSSNLKTTLLGTGNIQSYLKAVKAATIETLAAPTSRNTTTTTTALAAAGNKKRKFSCDQCSRLFGNPGALAGHKKAHQVSEKVTDDDSISRVCRVCWKSFSSTKELEKHGKIHGSKKV